MHGSWDIIFKLLLDTHLTVKESDTVVAEIRCRCMFRYSYQGGSEGIHETGSLLLQETRNKMKLTLMADTEQVDPKCEI